MEALAWSSMGNAMAQSKAQGSGKEHGVEEALGRDRAGGSGRQVAALAGGAESEERRGCGLVRFGTRGKRLGGSGWIPRE